MSRSAIVEKKNALVLALEAAKARNDRKAIRAIASEAYALEVSVAASFLIDERPGDAAVNFLSAASLLGDARRPVESERMLRLALANTTNDTLRAWISERVGEDAPGAAFQRPAKITGNLALRRPQREAFSAVHEHFGTSGVAAAVQLPVGCGKTGVMSILPFGLSNGRILVLAPNLEIAGNLRANLDYSSPRSFLRRTNVLDHGPGPSCAYLDGKANVLDADASDFVVSNIQQIVSRSAAKWLALFSEDYFDMVLVDEAHHSPANSWELVLSRFPRAKVVGFTATPLRSDGRPVPGKRVYRFPIAQAIVEGFVKDIASVRIEPEEIYFEFRGDRQRHSLAEVIRLREETWFSRGIALSPACNRSIVDESLRRMNELRSGGNGAKHQIIAVACSVDHARAIRSLYTERGYAADVLHSDLEDAAKEDVRHRLENGQLDVIVHVAMLGEGADYPRLSVAAIFRPFRHVVPYIQFVGRIMRVLHEGAPGHADNRGYVVSHVGLHVDRWWEELRGFDADDQALMEEIARGERRFSEAVDASPAEPTSASIDQRRRFTPELRVLEEIIRTVRTERFLAEDAHLLVDDVLSMLSERGLSLDVLGVSREELVRRLSSTDSNGSAKEDMAEPHPVQPQRARQEARRRLEERVRSGAKQLLNELGLSPAGMELRRLEPPASHNLAAAIIMLNRRVNSMLQIGPSERDLLSEADARRAHDAMDGLVDESAADVRRRRGGSDGEV